MEFSLRNKLFVSFDYVTGSQRDNLLQQVLTFIFVHLMVTLIHSL